MIKLLLIDIDQSRREWMCKALERGGFEIVAQVTSAERAVSNIAACHPQIILVAPDLFTMSGADATRLIMERHPIPTVLMIEQDQVNSALNKDLNWCGATATVMVPPLPAEPNHEARMQELINTLQLMYEVPVVKRASHERIRKLPLTFSRTSHEFYPRTETTRKIGTQFLTNNSLPNIIGIASSTGGPPVVHDILSVLEANYPIPIVLVQHLSEGFSKALIRWLDEQLALSVKEVENNETALPGHLYIASGQQHLVVERGNVFRLINRREYPGHCPSATVFFKSLAAFGSKAVGVILTGMGDDGAAGLVELKKAGGLTLAQDMSSCVISSMPEQAIARGGVSSILTPRGISKVLSSFAKEHNSESKER